MLSLTDILTMLPFGFSFEELFYLGVFLTVAGGYRQSFLKASRSGGVFVGRAVGFIRQKRQQVFASSTQRAEMEALQSQLSDAMSQLSYIRHDIRSSTRPLRGGAGMAGHDAAKEHPSSAAVTQQAASSQQDAAHGDAGTAADVQDSSRTRAAPTLDLANPMASATADAATTPQVQNVAAPAANHSPGTLSAQQRFEQLQVEDPSGKTVYIGGVPLIPVSAAAANRGTAQRSGPVTGSELAEEALREQAVARKAAAFLAGKSSGQGG